MIIAILCLSMAGCAEQSLEKETDDIAKITVKNGVFDISVKQCISLLNEDLHKEELPLISEDFSQEEVNASVQGNETDKNGQPVTREETYTLYRAKITDTIELQLRSFESLKGGIPVIEVVNITGKKSQNDDADMLKQYFSVICRNVEPGFDVDNFNINALWNEHYEMGDLFFWCGQMNYGEDQVERLYLVTANSDLFSFYVSGEE